MPPMTSMSTHGQQRGRARRHPPELWRVPVLRTARMTRKLIRITVGDDTLATFPGGGGDQHVVLYFYDRDVALPEPLTLASARTMLGQVRPAMRSYTVRRHDPVAHELDIDFVLHGTGVAAAWAQRAAPGDPLILVGPSPAYVPPLDVPRHLLIGDETALPAIAAMLTELPASADVTAVVEIADASEAQDLPGVHWLYRDGHPSGTADLLAPRVRSLTTDGGDVAVWAAGERGAMQQVRAVVLGENGLDRRRVRTTTYWRHGAAGTAAASA
jgi:NADPH-dependent ferric siderophore reductase